MGPHVTFNRSKLIILQEIYGTQQHFIKKHNNIFGEDVMYMKNYDIPAGTNDVIVQPVKNAKLLTDVEQSTYC